MLLAHLRFAVVQVGFSVTQDWVAEKLCENRERPEVLCLGSCVLEKALKAAKKQSNAEQKMEITDAGFNCYYLISDFPLKVDWGICRQVDQLSFLPLSDFLLKGRTTSPALEPPESSS